MKTEIDIADHLVIDVLIAAFEQSVSWAKVEGYYNGAARQIVEKKGALRLTVLNDNETAFDGKSYQFDVANVKIGLGIMANKYPGHFANMIDSEWDCVTGDVLVQCAVFGEIIYG